MYIARYWRGALMTKKNWWQKMTKMKFWVENEILLLNVNFLLFCKKRKCSLFAFGSLKSSKMFILNFSNCNLACQYFHPIFNNFPKETYFVMARLHFIWTLIIMIMRVFHFKLKFLLHLTIE
jgi:hypothetical protein